MAQTTLTCDRCDKPFAVEDANIGDKVQCPLCGDVNIIRAGAAKAQVDDAAAAAGYPPRLGPEVDVCRLRPAMMRSRPLVFFGTLLVGVAGCAGGIFGATTGLLPAAVGGAIAAIVAFGYLGYWKFQTLSDGIRITTRRIVDVTGLFSKNTSEVMIKDIRHVVVKQTFWQRIWNVGSLSILTAASDGVEVYMEQLAKPHEVKRIIDLYR
jgi:hypothetical protein